MDKINIKPIKNPDKIINYWLNNKTILLGIILFGITFDIGTVLGPIFQGKLIDSVIAGENINKVIIRIATFIGIILIVQILRFFKRFYVRRFANVTSGTMRLMIYNNIMNKDIMELNNESIGNLMTRAVSDVEICVEGMRKVTTEIFDTGILMTSYLVSMLYYDIKLTLCCCIFIPLAMFLAEKLKTIIYKYSKEYRKKSSEVTELTYDNIEHTILFRINGLEKTARENYFENLNDLQNKSIKANILENSMQPIYNAIALLGIISLIYFGSKNVINESWSIGTFSTYMLIFTALSVKASKAAKLFNSAQKSKISWLRIKPYLTQYTRKDSTPIHNTIDTELKVENLNFSYPNEENYIVENLSFSAKKGEIIGITGPIACGKSTLGIALLGLYSYDGNIKINHKELRDYTEFQRSELISYLGHNPQLLSDTIYNNIILGNNKDISEVLNHVCFLKDLETMELKENTVVGNSGVRLSGGQQARIALARTLLNKNKLIILDDPFSAIDMETEKQIIENLRKNYNDSIIIIISHRLSIFKNINKIIMLHKDKTYDYGTHEELLKSSPSYNTIYNLQNGGEQYEK